MYKYMDIYIICPYMYIACPYLYTYCMSMYRVMCVCIYIVCIYAHVRLTCSRGNRGGNCDVAVVSLTLPGLEKK